MIYICLYSFGKDIFLSECLKSIANSNTNDYFIDLYIFNKQSEIPNLIHTSNMSITVLHKLKSYSQVTNISLNKAAKNNAKFFLLLNTDTIIHPDCISNLIATISSNKHVGIVGGYQTEYAENWNTPNNWTNSNISTENYDKINTNNQSYILYKTSYVQGACMLFKTELVKEIGNFNERFKLFYEETEFCRRAIRKNYTIGIVRESKVKHYSGGSWKQNKKLNIRRDLYYLSNQIIFESTANVKTISNVVKNILFVISKQLKNIRNNDDNLRITFAYYPIVLLYVILRLDLIVYLYISEKKYVKEK